MCVCVGGDLLLTICKTLKRTRVHDGRPSMKRKLLIFRRASYNRLTVQLRSGGVNGILWMSVLREWRTKQACKENEGVERQQI